MLLLKRSLLLLLCLGLLVFFNFLLIGSRILLWELSVVLILEVFEHRDQLG